MFITKWRLLVGFKRFCDLPWSGILPGLSCYLHSRNEELGPNDITSKSTASPCHRRRRSCWLAPGLKMFPDNRVCHALSRLQTTNLLELSPVNVTVPIDVQPPEGDLHSVIPVHLGPLLPREAAEQLAGLDGVTLVTGNISNGSYIFPLTIFFFLGLLLTVDGFPGVGCVCQVQQLGLQGVLYEVIPLDLPVVGEELHVLQVELDLTNCLNERL